ncbi:Flp pilus assembly protein CpaB [Paraburkholderia sp.]|uniref:Flp pilus assembly protein CpaB n=1 Tax=Paraburkholderia sp. TaxID=1926495 RepID=UPI002D4BB473|nr:Flp pilus assembly protein CpaB [Paraburkholderia sp.]HZZ03351.1 Flp pilus assembly protein CpaB [Paraburkholderia sp.]
MSNTFKLLLLVLAAGLFAILARTLYLNSANTTPGPVETNRMIRAAAADLPEGLLLRDSDFSWRAVANDSVPAGAIVKGTEGIELKGALLRHPIAKDAIIVSADVIPANDPGFLAATLKPDMRAVSVAIDDVSGNAGLIQPGDYVDLLLTQQLDRQDASRDMSITSETVAQRVRVLAVGSQFQRPKGNTDTDARATARTVTLEVTPHRAEVIAVAAKLGSLSLALRSFARTAVANAASDVIEDAPAPVYAGDITHAARVQRENAPAAPPPGAVRPIPAETSVQVFRGSEKTSVGNGAEQSTTAWNSGVPPLPGISSLAGSAAKQPSPVQPTKGGAGAMKPIAQQYVDGVPVPQ